MGIVLDNIRQAALLAKAADDARANNKCCDEACEAKSVTEKVTPEAAMKDGFAELIQSVLESFIGVSDPKDLEAAIRAASTKLSERIVDNATAPKASDAFDKTVRDDVANAINTAIGTAVYESTDTDYRTERFVWYKVNKADIINSFTYDPALLTDVKIGKSIRLWAKCDHGAYTLYMGALNADNDDAFVDCIKQQVKDGTIPEPLGRVIFIMDILRKKITEMPVKTAAEVKATQNPPKKAKEKEVAPAAEATQNPAVPTSVDPVADAVAPVTEPEVVAQA